MSSLLFDRDGQVWSPDSYELRLRHHSTHLGAGFVRFGVVNMGFILATPRQTHIAINLRADFVTTKGLLALYYWMCRQPRSRVALTFEGAATPIVEVLSSQQSVLERVAHMRGNLSKSRKQYRKRERPDLLNVGPFADAVEYWRERRGTFTREELTFLSRGLLRNSYVLFDIKNADSFIFRDFGSALPQCALNWLQHSRGARLTDQPDLHYARLCETTYREVLRIKAPVADTVAALVRWEPNRDFARAYDRLMLPINLRDSSALLSATQRIATA